MDILAALKTEESKMQQQLDTVHAAIKIVIRESKPPDSKNSLNRSQFSVDMRFGAQAA